MKNTLFFVCPTDFIETEINKHFSGNNYFLTSLGNNYCFDREIIEQIKLLICSHNIGQLIFVSDLRNRFYLNVLNKITLDNSTSAVVELESKLEFMTMKNKRMFDYNTQLRLLATKNLSKQIKNLKKKFKAMGEGYNSPISIEGLLYEKEHSRFTSIDKYLIFDNPYSFN